MKALTAICLLLVSQTLAEISVDVGDAERGVNILTPRGTQPLYELQVLDNQETVESDDVVYVSLVTNDDNRPIKKFHVSIQSPDECGFGQIRGNHDDILNKEEGAVVTANVNVDLTKVPLRWKTPSCGCVTVRATIWEAEGVYHQDESTEGPLTRTLCIAVPDLEETVENIDVEDEVVSEPVVGPITTVEGGCLSGFTPFRDSCFKAFESPVKYEEASSHCSSLGGFLALPKDQDTVDFLLNDVADSLQSISFFIGLSDKEEEGRWIFADGTDLGWSNWAPGEPNKPGNESCTELYIQDIAKRSNAQRGQWNNVICGHCERPYICQVPLPVVYEPTLGNITIFDVEEDETLGEDIDEDEEEEDPEEVFWRSPAAPKVKKDGSCRGGESCPLSPVFIMDVTLSTVTV
ncbi:aggrecan core protein-like [Branchiostoma floridae]|uniref:Aggrecan core protein-like n=1 Tax=Branchiostoma floridae TaxID=7739 RepID=A0A9J7HUL4_BRAFL|nr:aggrecan core protein-like [Branchiostoma floridae]